MLLTEALSQLIPSLDRLHEWESDNLRYRLGHGPRASTQVVGDFRSMGDIPFPDLRRSLPQARVCSDGYCCGTLLRKPRQDKLTCRPPHCRNRRNALRFCRTLAQDCRRRLGTDRGIVHLFEGVRLRLRAEDGQYLDVPVVVVLNRLPKSQRLRTVHSVGRSMQHHVEAVGDRADTRYSVRRSSAARSRIAPDFSAVRSK